MQDIPDDAPRKQEFIDRLNAIGASFGEMQLQTLINTAERQVIMLFQMVINPLTVFFCQTW